MFLNFKSHIVAAAKFKLSIRIEQQVGHGTIGIYKRTENQVGVQNDFHFTKRLLFLTHQPTFTSLGKASTSDCFSFDFEVASL